MVSIIQNEILAKLPAQECDEPPGEFLVITHKSVIASEAKQSPCARRGLLRRNPAKKRGAGERASQ